MDFSQVKDTDLPPLPEIADTPPPTPVTTTAGGSDAEQRAGKTGRTPTDRDAGTPGSPPPPKEDDDETKNFVIPLVLSLVVTLVVGSGILFAILRLVQRPGIEPGTRVAPGTNNPEQSSSTGNDPDVLRDNGSRNGSAGTRTEIPTPTGSRLVPDIPAGKDPAVDDRLPTVRPFNRTLPKPEEEIPEEPTDDLPEEEPNEPSS